MANAETIIYGYDSNYLRNFSLNGSSEADENNLTFSPLLTSIIAIIAGSMSFVTITGNVFVIVAFIIEKSLRKYSNYFILNLSIADLLIGILIPPYTPFLLYKRNWMLGRAACTLWLLLDYVVGSASVLCIVVISLDRYLLVSRGLKYVADQKVHKAICIMVTVWVIAFLNYAPAIVFWEYIAGRRTVKDGACHVEFHDNLVYLTATACVEFFAPLISICTLNLAVYLNIRKRSKGLIRSENPMFDLDKVKANNSANQNSLPSTNNKTPTADTSKIDKRLSNVERVDEKKNDAKSKNNKSKTKKSITASSSSTTCSTSSIDEDVPVMKNNRSNKNNKKVKNSINENEILLKEISSNDKKAAKSEASVSNPSSNDSKPEANSRPSVVVAIAHIPLVPPVNKSSAGFTAYKTPAKKTNTTRATLTKDKKAARSLFILVFVFVFCWVNFK
jgi:muscarinic acetylcholine receptor M4